MQVYNSHETLPRPTTWVPGPPAPWSSLLPDQRQLRISSLQEFLEKSRSRRDAMNELGANTFQELPESALENLGDDDVSTKPAAVLVPFIVEGDEAKSVIVMTRTTSVSHHKGQVSFPGGMVENQDASAIDTALRETYEEIGLGREHFTVLGVSESVSTRTKTGFITPVVATCTRDALNDIVLSTEEVQSLHIIDLEKLVQPDVYTSEIWDFGELSATIHMYFAIDDQGNNVFIWGATAHMLTDLLTSISALS